MKTDQSHSILRETAALILAAAVVEIFPTVKLKKGREIPNGFFYDFVFPFPFNEDFLSVIEEKMCLIVHEKRKIEQLEIMPANAAELFEHRTQHFQASLARNQDTLLISLVRMGEFVDFAAPQYSDHSGGSGSFKLREHIEKENFTRIYGAAFIEKCNLKEFVKTRKSLHFKDHLELGGELNLFSAFKERGNGAYCWHPKGETVRQELLEWWKKEHIKQNFDFISTPRLRNSIEPSEEITTAHIQTFLNTSTTQKPLDRFDTVRLAESTLIELPELHRSDEGMLTSRTYFYDQAHIFCSEETLLDECISSLQFILKIPKILSFENYQLIFYSSGLNKKTNQALQKKRERILTQALHLSGLDYMTKENGSTAGPRLEIQVRDSLGRYWAGPFIGIDYVRPSQLGLPYSVLVRSAFGPLERLCALMLEQSEGKLPFWLAPEQIRIIVVDEPFICYAREVKEALQSLKLRVKIDERKEKLGKRMYEAISDKVPYIIVIGKQEQQTSTIALRSYNSDETKHCSVDFSLRLFSQVLTCAFRD